MAYVSEETIIKARAALKALNKEYGVKSTLSGKGSTSLNLTIAEGSIDFVSNYCNTIQVKRTQRDVDSIVKYTNKDKHISVNQYYLDSSFSDKALEYLEKVKDIMYANHWDKSDSQSDYFDCAYYIHMRIGKWNKGYNLVS